ncbi:hypothetical protein [Actinomyces dentalis]|uniref:variant leucine-rich repeat-containing protein n=1 Tax=Actinomyces dentalis TaxID=272548 RepID=UPI002353F3CF|nr:hypothetical protein [Actinomyces dentalis]
MTDSSEFSPEQAADPGTSMQDMARIAAERPDLWASLAANPSLYPGLREWLGQVDDPAVKEALSASAQRAAERVPAGDESAEAPAAEEAPTDAAPAAEVEDVKADGAEADSAQEAPTAEAVSIEDASEPATAEAPTTEIAVDSAQEAPTAAMGTPPPPPSAPTAAMGAPPPPPARAGGKRRRKKWVPIAAVLAVVLAVGGGTFAVYTYLTQRGAASPDEVMSTVSQAIADKDIISMFKMVSPSEIDTVADSADAIRDGGSDSRKGSSKADPGALLSKDAINNYLEALDVSTSDMTYTVDQKSDDLAVATISSWHLDVRVDQSLADTLRTRYQSAKGSSLTDDEEEFFSDLDFSDLSYDGDVADDFRDDIPLEIVMIKEDGRWFISPLMTSAQWNYRDRAQWDDDVEAPNYEADFSSVKGADSPEAAVQNLTEAILDARRPSDMLEDNVTGLLSLPERRLAMVYGPVMVGDDRKFSERASENVKIDWDLTSTGIGGGQAVVQPGNSKITLNPDDEDEKITFEFKGNTMKVTTPASENNTASVDFTRQLKDPDRLGVVVEKSDGTWHVSSSGTIVNIFNLRPSERALDKFSDTLEDLGVDPDDSDDLADTITQSVAIATPILVGVDIAEQLQDVKWRASYRPSYDSYDSYSGYSTADYYSQCTSGDMSACDRLYYASSSGSFDESYGRSCGGRNYSLDYGGQCESRYGRWY